MSITTENTEFTEKTKRGKLRVLPRTPALWGRCVRSVVNLFGKLPFSSGRAFLKSDQTRLLNHKARKVREENFKKLRVLGVLRGKSGSALDFKQALFLR